MLGARALCLSSQILFLLVPVVCGLQKNTCHCQDSIAKDPCQFVDNQLRQYYHNSSVNISLCHPVQCGAVKKSPVCVEINGTQRSSGNGTVTYYTFPTSHSVEFYISKNGVNGTNTSTRIILNCGMNHSKSVTVNVSSDSLSLNLTIDAAENCSSLFSTNSSVVSSSLMTTSIAVYVSSSEMSFLPFTTTAPTSTVSFAPFISSPSFSLSSSAVSFFPSSSSSHIFPSSPPPMPASSPPLPHPSVHFLSSLPLPSSLPPPPPSSLPPPLSSFSSNIPFTLSFSLPSSPSPSPVCPTQPEDCPNCDECMKKLYIVVATTIPGSILITALAMLPLIWCFQKAKKRGTYIRMAPTVYFDEDDKD